MATTCAGCRGRAGLVERRLGRGDGDIETGRASARAFAAPTQ